MHQSGITTDNHPVLAGVFPLVGTHGVPLKLVLDFFKTRDLIVDWPDYIQGALKDGHKLRTLRGRILAAVGDVYGRKYAQAVNEKFDAYLAHNPTLSRVGGTIEGITV